MKALKGPEEQKLVAGSASHEVFISCYRGDVPTESEAKERAWHEQRVGQVQSGSSEQKT